MRVLVTGASGLIGSNLAAAAAQQSWTVHGTWHGVPVQLREGATSRLDIGDRHACVALAERFEPDVLVHAAASVQLSRLQHEPALAAINVLGTEHTLHAARVVRARYVLVSSDWVFGGDRPPTQCWREEDPTDPVNAYGRSKLACEQTVREWAGDWLITRPANVYGINLALPLAGESHARHVWERSSLALRWVEHLRAGRPLPAPPDVYQCPTYAWDYAQRVCELIAQDCDGIYNTAGPDALSRHDFLALLAQAFDCDPELVHRADRESFLRACGETPDLPLPFNTALCAARAAFALGRPAIDPRAGLRLMRDQLHRVLGPRPGATNGDPRASGPRPGAMSGDPRASGSPPAASDGGEPAFAHANQIGGGRR
ncbi:MAG TPA: sugar nucleotide-binding protein [Solirubrobacteraceae bacterium]|nr:sugar nucleotide-binding protein [Solirubrobacteraceae bacterium]